MKKEIIGAVVVIALFALAIMFVFNMTEPLPRIEAREEVTTTIASAATMPGVKIEIETAPIIEYTGSCTE